VTYLYLVLFGVALFLILFLGGLYVTREPK